MLIEHQIGEPFQNLSQRMLYTWAATFPGFVPVASAQADEQSQRELHGFLSSIIRAAYDTPHLLGLPADADDCYDTFELNKQKPALIDAMRAICARVNEFYVYLYKIGLAAEVAEDGFLLRRGGMRLGSKNLSLFPGLGLRAEPCAEGTMIRSAEFPHMFPAWKLLAEGIAARDADPAIAFSRCMLDGGHDYAADVYGELCGSRQMYAWMMGYFLAHGYERRNPSQLPGFSDSGLMVQWAKPLKKKDELGVSVWFDYRKKYPLKIELKVPHFRLLLRDFDGMDIMVKNIAIKRCKSCDGCGYCVQTNPDKLKKQTIPVEHRGEKHALCPYFPYLTWHGAYPCDVESMHRLMAFAEEKLA